ncbi:hypothetical protein P5G50_06490 [Leifsonia sp. F6_8S_P_1B]|uniref:Polyketide cyclase / dehydrase and lipid transport n=1 Tax=Leifsonia williamsii TaxID=3035919 RepID=A0ABT8KAR1_9MICO|nr:hypothetical protein [Leifsonia williamsii]MDN4614098.1 hypothetical protein [Leifsonia williamsii]
MSVTRFSLTSSLDRDALMDVLTDFSSARPAAWSSIDEEHFRVHGLGAGWAEVTEGTAQAWERARYEWDRAAGTVTITTHDSKVFGPGGGWLFQLTPEGRGTRVDVRLTRTPAKLGQRILAGLLPLVGPASLKKSFAAPLQAV